MTCMTCRRESWKRFAQQRRASERAARAGMALLLLVALVMVPTRGRADDASLRRGDTGPRVAEVQTILASYRYTVVVDSRFGPQTEKAVKSWQRSNGLKVDGVVGSATLSSLRQAVRVGNAHMVGGLNGLPFAPADLTGCDEARFYRQQWGLPAQFDAITWRESNCKNYVTSRTGCCVGYLQLHYINWRDHRTIAGLAACDATWANVKGDSPESKQRQMCAAKVLYDVVGMQPWRLTA